MVATLNGAAGEILFVPPPPQPLHRRDVHPAHGHLDRISHPRHLAARGDAIRWTPDPADASGGSHDKHPSGWHCLVDNAPSFNRVVAAYLEYKGSGISSAVNSPALAPWCTGIRANTPTESHTENVRNPP